MGAGVQRWWRDGSRYRAEVAAFAVRSKLASAIIVHPKAPPIFKRIRALLKR